MRQRAVSSLIDVYERVVNTGILDRPRAQQAFEAVYLGYKQLLEAGPVGGLERCVEDGTTVLDLGANIGFFSVRFGRWVGPTGRVVAIEPEQRNLASLRRRIARAGLERVVECVAAAAADTPGELRLARTPSHPGDHHLAPDGDPVRAVTVDELTASDPRRLSLIKIDVQGAEALAVAGAHRAIERHRPALFIEIDGPSLSRMGSSPAQLVETMSSLGYQPRELTSRGPGRERDTGELIAAAQDGYIDTLFTTR
jgi:FkbM family methyltransferase